MSTKIDIANALMPALSGIGGALGAVFWTKKWIAETDKKFEKVAQSFDKVAHRLERLGTEVSKLRTKVEVSSQISNTTDGRLEETRRSIDDLRKVLEKASGSVQALWYLVDSNKEVLKK